MASLPMGTSMHRDLRRLLERGVPSDRGDADLLSRFAEDGDEEAFAALVGRHGPMVLATCLGVLGDPHEAEDAFQAAFLTLARRSGSIREGEALGPWLHRVAARIAARAGQDAHRRRLRERLAARGRAEAVGPARPADDLGPVLHEEIARLPRAHRAAVVLCYLEGRTYEQAAREMGWTVPALRTRLARARGRLGERLSRRGVTAGAALAALERAPAAVPPALTASAVCGAVAGAGPGVLGVLGLARAWGLVAAGLAMAVGAAWAMGRGGDRPPVRPAVGPAPAVVTPAPAPRPATDATVEVRGRVLGPDGAAVAGATVRPAIDLPPASLPEARSGDDGGFRLEVPKSAVDAIRARERDGLKLVASAPGFGPGRADLDVAAGPPGEAVVRLVPPGPAIEGRILDGQGRPVAGARVEAQRLWAPASGDLAPWARSIRDGSAPGFRAGLDPIPDGRSAETGPDGRFRLEGLGRDRLAELIVSGPTVASSRLFAMTRDEAPLRWATRQGGREAYEVHPPKFDAVAAPSQPIEGTIRDKDTGRPIAGVQIRGNAFNPPSHVWNPDASAVTDDRGRYRLSGLHAAPAYRLFALPGRGVPYPQAAFRVEADAPGPVAFDFALTRGVVVRGRVTDAATGRPVRLERVNVASFPDNPHLADFPGFRDSSLTYGDLGDDGTYEVVIPPGRGLLGVRAEGGRYRGAHGFEGIQGYDPEYRSFLTTIPEGLHPANYHALIETDFPPGTESATRDLALDPGRSLAIRVAGPEGKPLTDLVVRGADDLFASLARTQPGPEVEVRSLAPGEPRRVTVTHSGRKLAGSVYLNGDEAGPITLTLQPWAEITGRIVDDAGQPREGVGLTVGGVSARPPSERAVLPDGDLGGGIPAGPDGRFRVAGLVPGLSYGADASERGEVHIGTLFDDLTLAPGEARDLGDLKVRPYANDGAADGK